jgi:hypothetical protein
MIILLRMIPIAVTSFQAWNLQGNYEDIFRQKIPANISKTLFNISQLRKDLVEE